MRPLPPAPAGYGTIIPNVTGSNLEGQGQPATFSCKSLPVAAVVLLYYIYNMNLHVFICILRITGFTHPFRTNSSIRQPTFLNSQSTLPTKDNKQSQTHPWNKDILLRLGKKRREKKKEERKRKPMQEWKKGRDKERAGEGIMQHKRRDE